VLLGGAAAAAGTALTGCGAPRSAGAAGSGTTGFGSATVPFHGPHQAGVTTDPQAHALFIALDLVPPPGRDPREALRAVLKLWTADAARLTRGRPAVADTEPELAEHPARLTVTVGLGPALFDRVGLAALRPPTVAELPGFATDRLEPAWCGGDLLLQLCGDDPVALAHAARVLLKNTRTLTRPRWRQTGFRNAYGARPDGTAMRNLMGQVDGTVNPRGEDAFDRYVWDDGAAAPWFAGGTVAIVRRIRMELDTWDELDRTSKELTVGRRLDTGAPLTGEHEFDEPDFAAEVGGIPVIPPNAHIALARRRTDDEQFLRRPYNYDDPPAPGATTDCGLIFVTYQRDPARQFVPVQQRLAEADALNPWITTIGSAVFAILPGVRSDRDWLGRGLFERG